MAEEWTITGLVYMAASGKMPAAEAAKLAEMVASQRAVRLAREHAAGVLSVERIRAEANHPEAQGAVRRPTDPPPSPPETAAAPENPEDDPREREYVVVQTTVETLAHGELPTCECGNDAVCVGVAEGRLETLAVMCDECCGHGNEDGWCVPLEKFYPSKRRASPARSEGTTGADEFCGAPGPFQAVCDRTVSHDGLHRGWSTEGRVDWATGKRLCPSGAHYEGNCACTGDGLRSLPAPASAPRETPADAVRLLREFIEKCGDSDGSIKPGGDHWWMLFHRRVRSALRSAPPEAPASDTASDIYAIDPDRCECGARCAAAPSRETGEARDSVHPGPREAGEECLESGMIIGRDGCDGNCVDCCLRMCACGHTRDQHSGPYGDGYCQVDSCPCGAFDPADPESQRVPSPSSTEPDPTKEK